MPFTFPLDSNNKAGAVKATTDGNNFFIPAVIYGSDGVTAISSTNPLPSSKLLFNESTYDVERNNTQGTMLASAARTANVNSSTQTNYNARGVMLTLYVSAVGGTGGITVKVFPVDPVTGNWVTALLTGSIVTATGSYTYGIYPGVSGGYTSQVSAALPRTWVVQVLHSDATTYNYSLGYSLIL